MQIIPAIDIIDGKCVRLRMGDYADKTVYADNPLEVAREFEAAGIQRLHLVDPDGAKARKIVNGQVLKDICNQTSLVVDFGGGVSGDAEIGKAFELGAAMVTAGSIAVREPKTVLRWLEVYGVDRIILGADAKGEKIAVSGWEEDSGLDIVAFIDRYYRAGARKVISTDIEKDGMLQGPSCTLYKKLLSHFPDLKLIASGGVATAQDLSELKEMGIYGTIVGKAYYEGRVTLTELASYAN